KLDTMRAFGADLLIVDSDGGKITPPLFDKMRAEVTRMLAEGNTFWTDQFNNQDAISGYMGIGRELIEQTGGRLDAFCGAVGTSSALNVVAALKLAKELGPGKVVATVAIDTGLKYLAGDLFT